MDADWLQRYPRALAMLQLDEDILNYAPDGTGSALADAICASVGRGDTEEEVRHMILCVALRHAPWAWEEV